MADQDEENNILPCYEAIFGSMYDTHYDHSFKKKNDSVGLAGHNGYSAEGGGDNGAAVPWLSVEKKAVVHAFFNGALDDDDAVAAATTKVAAAAAKPLVACFRCCC